MGDVDGLSDGDELGDDVDGALVVLSHDDCPVELCVQPAGHNLHALISLAFWYHPRGHRWHCTLSGRLCGGSVAWSGHTAAGAYSPGPHTVHPGSSGEASGFVLKRPAGQPVQRVAPAAEKKPSVHLSHEAL